MTIFNSVTETEIREVVFGKSSERAAPKFLTWTDVTGKYKIEAVFVEIDVDSLVVLKKKDGRVIRIPLHKLSKEDARRVGQ